MTSVVRFLKNGRICCGAAFKREQRPRIYYVISRSGFPGGS